MVRGLIGPANTNTAHQSPTFQREAMRVSTNSLQGSSVGHQVKKNITYSGVNKKHVCVRKKNQQPQLKKIINYTHQLHKVRTKISSFYDDVLYRFALNIFTQLKTVGRAETFESWPSEKGVNSK